MKRASGPPPVRLLRVPVRAWPARALRGAALTAACLSAAASAGAHADGEALRRTLIKGIAAAQSRIRSAKCTIAISASEADTVLKDSRGRRADTPGPAQSVTIVATKGPKYYWRQDLDRAGPVVSWTVCDGTQSFMCTAPKRRTSGQPTMWVPTTARLPGVKEWMYDVSGKNIVGLLRDRRYTGMGRSSSREHGPTVTVTFDARKHLGFPDGGTASVEIAPAYGYAIVRTRTNGRIVQEIAGFVRKDGIALPSAATRTFFVSQGGRTQAFRDEKIAFSKLQINNVPDSLFEVKIKPGDIVQQGALRFRVGPNGERVLERLMQ